ncbi:hypothetical protein [Spiroplasma endosymbiont of Sarcophaga carnaria]|uniref:hypothetical protein n=1 Tax=Spiroplasma endosymbiont of Sarcophaga carnaria TaxID=3066303 RepID=UPI0030D1B32D
MEKNIDVGNDEICYQQEHENIKLIIGGDSFNFVENSWWNKKNHQYDNLKTNFV